VVISVLVLHLIGYLLIAGRLLDGLGLLPSNSC